MIAARVVEIKFARHVIEMLDSMVILCRVVAPRASLILAAAAQQMREDYPEANEEPEA